VQVPAWTDTLRLRAARVRQQGGGPRRIEYPLPEIAHFADTHPV